MTPTVIIQESGSVGVGLSAQHVRDLSHIRRMLLQAFGSVEGESIDPSEYAVSTVEIARLRGFLSERGIDGKSAIRRLLLMTLLDLEDEDESRRLYVASAILPVLTGKR